MKTLSANLFLPLRTSLGKVLLSFCLSVFEWQLLIPTNNPLYSNSSILPIQKAPAQLRPSTHPSPPPPPLHSHSAHIVSTTRTRTPIPQSYNHITTQPHHLAIVSSLPRRSLLAYLLSLPTDLLPHLHTANCLPCTHSASPNSDFSPHLVFPAAGVIWGSMAHDTLPTHPSTVTVLPNGKKNACEFRLSPFIPPPTRQTKRASESGLNHPTIPTSNLHSHTTSFSSSSSKRLRCNAVEDIHSLSFGLTSRIEKKRGQGRLITLTPWSKRGRPKKGGSKEGSRDDPRR